jgi:hypothetical protein
VTFSAPIACDLAAQDGELVAQHQDLQVLGTVAAGQQDKQLDGAVSKPGQGTAKASPYGAASRDRQRLGSPARY